MKLILLFPSGAGGDFLVGLYLLYKYNIPLYKNIRSRWILKSVIEGMSKNVIAVRAARYQSMSHSQIVDDKVITGHLIKELELDLYKDFCRSQIVGDSNEAQHMAMLYTMKHPGHRFSECERSLSYVKWRHMAIKNANDQCVPVDGFTHWLYSDLFSEKHSTIPQLFESWGIVIPDQDAFLLLLQYYNKCNDLLLKGFNSESALFNTPDEINQLTNP